MSVKRVSPEEAKALIDTEGYVYVDVRSQPEFQAGHPMGACNVPLMHMGPEGMSANPEFLSVMEKAFPKDAKLVLGCKAGGRSMRAASILESAGYAHVVDQRAGFEGAMEPGTGRVVEPGWRPKGLPVSQECPPEHAYEGLKGR
jgi:rhodanese-related sulfurtransferase